ncbi:MAG: WD40 repeat domain-containing protein, partial [Planctomyces sp.]
LETALPHDRAFGAAANDLPPLGAVFAPQADAMLTWHWDNFAYLWDAKSGRRLQAFRQDEVLIDGTAISAAINNDGSLLLTSSPEYNDTPTKLWDVDTGMVLREFFAKGGAFSSDGSYVAVAERKGIRIFDLRILAD